MTEPTGTTDQPKPVRRRRASAAQGRAGAENLAEYLDTADAPPALSSGVYAAATRAGLLPPGREALQELVDQFFVGWVSDAGGPEALTASKRALLWTARGALSMYVLGLKHVRENGLVDGLGQVQPVAKCLISFLNSMRLNLLAVGLERVPRSVTTTLEQRMNEIAVREKGGELETKSQD